MKSGWNVPGVTSGFTRNAFICRHSFIFLCWNVFDVHMFKCLITFSIYCFLEFWRYGRIPLISLSINNQQMHFIFQFLMRVSGMLLGVTFLKSKTVLTILFYSITWSDYDLKIDPIQDGLFRGCLEKSPISKICHTYPTTMKLGTVIPYLKKIQKICKSRDTPSEFCWCHHFFIGNQKILLYQEIRKYRMHFDS